MMNTSKILTVSYGTFSCTLEGFDDSFDTMKAIAEYFRDLASDDRYFGAEPPVPDAEMLARIAEREISRRVEASESEGNYVLRAHSEAPQSRIADGAGIVAATMLDEATNDAAQNDSSSLLADDTPVAKEEITPTDNGIADVAEIEEIDIADETDAGFEGFVNDPIAPADPESVAAKLQRIRAVVSQDTDATADDSYIEDEHAVDFLGKTVSDLSSALEFDDIAEDITDVPAIEPTKETESSIQISDAVSEITAEIADDKADITDLELSDDQNDDILELSDALEAEVDENTDDNTDGDEDEITDFLNRMNKLDDSDTNSILDDDDDNDDDYSLFAEDDDQDVIPETSETNTAEQASEPTPTPVRARVLKMKRTDFEAAVSDGRLEEDEAESTLSDQDEAELLKELAAVQAGDDNDLADEKPAQDIRPKTSRKDSDTDVSRILAETNTQMDEPQGKTRREGIAHLRAAVAATQAEKAAGNDTTIKADTSSAYRDDLAAAVRPRRPVSQNRSNRPTTPAPAPLKLVAEQRIDADAGQPVRPRRVSVAQMAAQNEQMAEDIQDDDNYVGTFAEFAEEVGATKLPDLLEAAAAYLAFVEGREKFSRPQLMTKVRQVELDDFSREDGLRSFGQLLRQGKLEKLKGGRFTVSDRIGYKPDERYVG